jgi:hypothetical protein
MQYFLLVLYFRLSCHGFPASAVLFILSVRSIMFRLYCPSSPVPVFLSEMSYLGYPVWDVYPSCLFSTLLSRLSYSGCTVSAVLSLLSSSCHAPLSCLGCPISAFLFLLFLYSLFCPRCRLAVAVWAGGHIIAEEVCNDYPVLTVLPYLSCQDG